jgi:hypothetical protein
MFVWLTTIRNCGEASKGQLENVIGMVKRLSTWRSRIGRILGSTTPILARVRTSPCQYSEHGIELWALFA